MARLSTKILPELTKESLTQLFSHNIFTVVDFVSESNDKLMKYTGLSCKDISDIKACIFETFSGSTRSAKEELLNDIIISTGIEKLDSLLSNGLHAGFMYEICGSPACGKSQLCHVLAANVMINSSVSTYYIDTKGDFCATRLLELLESKKCTDEQIGRIMSSIKVSRVNNKEELLALLHHFTDILKSCTTSLIIIDSLPAIFFKTSKDNSVVVTLNQLATVCKYLATEHRHIVITTNIVSQWREIDGFVVQKQSNPLTQKPALGKYWLHVPDVRILMEQLENEERKMTIWKSTCSKLEMSCKVSISNAGIN